MKKLITPIIVLMMVAACSGGGSSPADVASDFSKAVYDKDWEKAKELSTESSAQMIDMIASMAAMSENMGGDSLKVEEKEPFKFEVVKDSVSEDGEKAFVYYQDKGEEKKMELKKVDGEWKVVFSKS